MRIALAIGALALLLPGASRAGVYWQNGVRSSSISVCFVGDAVTSRPARVQQVISFIREYEWAANIHFAYTGTCAASVRQPNGNDYYSGDVRVVIPNTSVSFTGMVPGVGCPLFLDSSGHYNHQNDGFGSWSNAPNDLEANRACQYNLKLGDDGDARGPYLNHTLHEFGHALGLAHEHSRADANAPCTEAGYRGSLTSYITTYDRAPAVSMEITTTRDCLRRIAFLFTSSTPRPRPWRRWWGRRSFPGDQVCIFGPRGSTRAANRLRQCKTFNGG